MISFKAESPRGRTSEDLLGCGFLDDLVLVPKLELPMPKLELCEGKKVFWTGYCSALVV